MIHAPLWAWRKLFAVGGAPAASHAVLARTPATIGSLEPLAAVAENHSLDALARPLDVSIVLARSLEAIDSIDVATDVDRGIPARVRPRAAMPAMESRASSSRRAMVPVSPANSESLLASPPAARDDPPARPALARVVPPAVTTGRGRASPVEAAGDQAVGSAVSSTDAEPPTMLSRDALAAQARAGAAARVFLDAPVADIERLLALGDTSSGSVPETPAAAHRHRTPAAGETASVVRAASAPTDIAARHPTELAPPPALTSQKHWNAGYDLDISTSVGTPAIELSAEQSAVGGFRGLARRTLTSSSARPRLPVRLERETRMPADLAFDALDTRVADSLARILAREARRHGIDIAETLP